MLGLELESSKMKNIIQPVGRGIRKNRIFHLASGTARITRMKHNPHIVVL